jgi:hypothetical protein
MPALVCLLAADEAPDDFLAPDFLLRFPDIATSGEQTVSVGGMVLISQCQAPRCKQRMMPHAINFKGAYQARYQAAVKQNFSGGSTC